MVTQLVKRPLLVWLRSYRKVFQNMKWAPQKQDDEDALK